MFVWGVALQCSRYWLWWARTVAQQTHINRRTMMATIECSHINYSQRAYEWHGIKVFVMWCHSDGMVSFFYSIEKQSLFSTSTLQTRIINLPTGLAWRALRHCACDMAIMVDSIPRNGRTKIKSAQRWTVTQIGWPRRYASANMRWCFNMCMHIEVTQFQHIKLYSPVRCGVLRSWLLSELWSTNRERFALCRR